MFSRFPFTRGSNPDDGGVDDSAEPPLTPRPRRPPRRWRLAKYAGLILLLVVAFGCWLGYEALHAKSGLQAARDNAVKTKDSISQGSRDDAAKWADAAQTNAQSARDATHSLPWNIAAAIPYLGSPLKTVQQISDVVLGLTGQVLQPAVQVGEAISPNRLVDAGGRINVELLRDAAPKLSEISAAAKSINTQAGAIADPAYLSAVHAARGALQTQTSDLSGLLDKASIAAQLVPSMMGADGPRTYFMGFQTNAEARGTGGLLGGFGILHFDNGTPKVETLGRNTELDKAFTPLNLGPPFDAQYGYADPTTDYRNSNLSSHFPYAAQIWKSMWEQQSGTAVDGVIAIDPVALSYILGVVGPVTLADGETITKDNVVELTESTAYIRFADDTLARKAYLQDIAGAVVKKMTGSLPSPRQLLDALGRGVSEGRIAVWSSSPAEQQLLEQTPLAHEIPDDPAPYAGVVINNIGGNKLDYYLTREIEYSAGACDSDTRTSTVTVRLTNNVPDAPLPDYVAGSLGLRGTPLQVPQGTNVAEVTLLATTGAKLTGAFVDGVKKPISVGLERGHTTFDTTVNVERGRTVELKFELTEPTSPGAPRVPVQPLIDTVKPAVSVPVCAGS